MAQLLLVLALLWIVAGTFLILDTERTRSFFGSVVPPERLGWFAWPALVLAAVLVVGAFVDERMFAWPFLLGLAAGAKGVLLLRAPDRARALMEWWTEGAPEETCRALGLGIFSLGAALLGYLF